MRVLYRNRDDFCKRCSFKTNLSQCGKLSKWIAFQLFCFPSMVLGVDVDVVSVDVKLPSSTLVLWRTDDAEIMKIMIQYLRN